MEKMLNEKSIAIMQECTTGSQNNTMKFPEVVRKLLSIHSERYYTDFFHDLKIYYLANGECYDTPTQIPKKPIPDEFFSADVESALEQIKSGAINYTGFVEKLQLAGCVGYMIFINGKKGIYFGRKGEFYIQHFADLS